MSDDEENYNKKSHKNLLHAISSLGKTQHIRESSRTEAQQQDEFRLIKGRASSLPLIHKKSVSVDVGDIVQLLKTRKKHLDAGKKLKNAHSTRKVLEKPLEKPAADRIKRTVGFEKVKKELARWDAVVAQNRAADTQVFPLRGETIYINTAQHTKPVQLSLKSELMQEMEATEAKLRALKKERVGDKDNEEDLAKREEQLLQKKLTRDELLAKRKELAYLKLRESQKSAKARQRNKIKSKKYHKLIKRQKIQEQLKGFELLQKTNPEAALEKLNELERTRVLERASLRHKNTGSWAKNLQVRAKYDKDARKDLAEQLQVSRQLTEKKQEESDNENEDHSKIVLEQQLLNEKYDPFNPWTRVTTKVTDKNDEENKADWRKYWLERNENEKKLRKFNEEINDELEQETKKSNTDIIVEKTKKSSSLTKTNKKPKIENGKKRTKFNEEINDEFEQETKKSNTDIIVKKTKKSSCLTKTNKKPKIENGWIIEEIELPSSETGQLNIDDLFDAQEDKIRNKLDEKMEMLKEKAKVMKSKRKPKEHKNKKDKLNNLKNLSFKNDLKRPIIDEELMHENDGKEESAIKAASGAAFAQDQVINTKKDQKVNQPTVAQAHVDTIDPSKITVVNLRQPFVGSELINDSIEDFAVDEESEDPTALRQITISEAFEDDDIVADFSKDKAKETELKNNEIELSMPGWGSWAGAGISKKRSQSNKRFVLNLADVIEKEALKRRDDNKGGLYINEEAGKQLRSHLVSDLPFPFTTVQDYEASIRAPLGRNFVPETAFRMLTRPTVITAKGKIIEPMDESELFKRPRKIGNEVDRRIAAQSSNTSL